MFVQTNMNIKVQRCRGAEVQRGFTLIELLVAISIIGVLISIAAPRYIVAEKQARDTRRKSDLNQYRVALENYAAVNNSLYPTPAGTTGCAAGPTLCSGTFVNFMSVCPRDPRTSSTYYYQYCANSGTYVLSTKLETTGNIWQVCSSGVSCVTTRTGYPSGGSVSCAACQL